MALNAERRWSWHLKVLIYSHYFAPSVGGVERITNLLARYLQENGHETTIVTQIPTSEEDKWPFRVIRRPRMRKLLREIRRADVVQTQGFVLLPFLLSKIVGRPVVWSHYGYDLTCPKQIGWKDGQDTSFKFSRCTGCLLRDHSTPQTFALVLLLILKRLFRRFADAHVAPSRYLLDREGLTGEIIPSSVDTQLYSPGGQGRVSRRILFVGRVVKEKGVAVLIDALDLLTRKGGDYSVQIVGNGYELPQIRQLVREKGLGERLLFESWISNEEELIARIRGASAVCAPTLNAEPFGGAGLEAMSCETPLVASDKGGFSEFARGIAFLVPPGDAEALAVALERASSEDGSAERIRAGRQRAIEGYDYRVVGLAYLKLYASVIRRKAEQ